MVVMPKTERWQHEPWGAIDDYMEPRRGELVSVGELGQWRLASIGRAGTG